MTFGELNRMKKVEHVKQTQPKVYMGNHVEKFFKESFLPNIYFFFALALTFFFTAVFFATGFFTGITLFVFANILATQIDGSSKQCFAIAICSSIALEIASRPTGPLDTEIVF